MALVIDRPNFKLHATVAPADGKLFNLELKQRWPQAQLNPTREELIALRDAIQEALDD